RRAPRAALRLPAPVFHSYPALFIRSAQPLVAGLAANAEAVTELGHRPGSAATRLDELPPLVHGHGLHPRHGLTSGAATLPGVTHVPGLLCNPCPRSIPDLAPNPSLQRTLPGHSPGQRR